MLERLWRGTADLVFPPTCIGCGLRGTQLCSDCSDDLPWLAPNVCHRCSTWRRARGACRGCRQLSPHLATVRAAFAYEGAARTAVLTLKFRGGRRLAPLMGALLRSALAIKPVHADVLVPVPLSRERLRQRGYNQALLLATQVTAVTGGALVLDALERRERAPQQTLGAASRLTNLQGAIRCVRPIAVVGRRVVIVDDVVTTGATVSSCAEVLASAGAVRVSAVAFARDL